MKKVTKNNKGFSLIELIIVIAIMAVLVAIIAPNLTKYLGSSKKNTDAKNLDEIEATLKTCITDYETTNGDLIAAGAATNITVKFGGSGATVTPANTSFKTIIDEAIDASKTQSKQTSGKVANAVITKNASGNYKIVMSWV